MDQPQAMKVPIEQLREDALKHYEEASSAIHCWSSFVEKAIKAYNPESINQDMSSMLNSKGEDDLGLYEADAEHDKKLKSINQDLSQCSNACDWPNCTKDNCVDKNINQEGSLKDSDWKIKIDDLFYYTPSIGNETIKREYENPSALQKWIEENVIAPLLQSEYKGDDLESSSKSLGNDIGDAVRSSALTQIEQEQYSGKDMKRCFEAAREEHLGLGLLYEDFDSYIKSIKAVSNSF